eukprot:gene33017-44174_t
MTTSVLQNGIINLLLVASFIRSFHLSKLIQHHLPPSSLLGSPSLSYDIEAWKRGYESCIEEICEVISTTLPPDLGGTYFRNGLGKFEVGDDFIAHPFDADGMITAITIKNSSAIFPKKITSRGAFGTSPRGGPLANFLNVKFKNVANTNVVYWGGKLLALWEAGLPHRLEADSLRTV